MCGRARLSSDVSEIKIAFGIPPERPTPNIAPSWNLAPTDPAPIVYYDAKDGGRRLEVMRWGLIPYWAKDIKIGFSTINARAEEVDTKPAFREAFRQRRCLVPLDSFYEWKKIGTWASPAHSGTLLQPFRNRCLFAPVPGIALCRSALSQSRFKSRLALITNSSLAFSTTRSQRSYFCS